MPRLNENTSFLSFAAVDAVDAVAVVAFTSSKIAAGVDACTYALGYLLCICWNLFIFDLFASKQLKLKLKHEVL